MAVDVHRVLGWKDVKSLQAYLMKLLLQVELLQAPSRAELLCPFGLNPHTAAGEGICRCPGPGILQL